MISVVVPVYNVLPYLKQCVDSILTQSYADLEVILVDDGSTDGSSDECDRCAEDDSRVKVIHKANGGLSDARNVGVKAAVGEWIYFADSDDWLDPDAVRRLYEFAVAHDCDVVQGGLYYVYPDYLLCRNVRRKERTRSILGRHEAMRELIINDRVKNFAWGKLYKAELIKDLDFPEGKFFEDCFWQHRVVDRVRRYGIIDSPLYFYRQRADSISGTVSDKNMDLLEGYSVRLDFIRNKYPQHYDLMCKMYDKIYAQVYPKTQSVCFVRRVFVRVSNRLRAINRYKTVRRQ